MGDRYSGHPRWLARGALALGVGDAAQMDAARGLLDRVGAMTWRLMRPR
jgi:hypothetical protein